MSTYSFSVQISKSQYLGVDGHPSDTPFLLTCKIPRMIDDTNITRAKEELASKLLTNGAEDEFAYAMLLAQQESLAAQLRQGLAHLLFPGQNVPEEYEEPGAVESSENPLDALTPENIARAVAAQAKFRVLTVATASILLEQLASRNVTPERIAKVYGPGADDTVALLTSVFPQQQLLRLRAVQLKLEATENQLAAINYLAKWSVVAVNPPAAWKVLDAIPTWGQYARQIIRAWQEAENAALQGFTKPSGI